MLKLSFLLVLFGISTVVSAQSTDTVLYEEDFSVFANPERGFYHHTEVHTGNYSNLSTSTLQGYRENESITQILRVFYLEAFRRKPISDQYLDNIRSDFSAARKAGIKVIVRFAYAQSMSEPYNDATPEIVFMHIEQLKPVLRENADVNAVVQAGFIGAWGEWYYTDHFSKLAGIVTEENWEDRKKVVLGLLNALPTDRAVQIRTPGYKMILFDTEEPLGSDEAFSGTDYSRVGHHNDCFVASSSDFGTYVNPEVEKPYLEQETKFLPMGGETCALASPYSDCDFATGELERFHWSYLNIDYNNDVLDEWDNQGCFDEVELRLGYRVRLLSAAVTTETQPGGSVELSLQMINDGYSSPYNPRKFEVVLKNTDTEEEYYLDSEEDPRRWPVKEEFAVNFTAGLPEEMPEGNYQLFLNLPDPYPLLYGNPAYSIRLANEEVWNDTLGYNDLLTQVSVSAENATEDYSGDTFFGPRSAKNTIEVEGSDGLFGGSDDASIIVFWGRQPGYQRIIERSKQPGEFETIAALDGELDYFKDTDVEQGITYSYRYYLTENASETMFSDTLNLSLKPTAGLPEITIDGEDEDWDAIAPISSATSTENYALRAYFDGENANFILYGPVNSYSVYLDTDNDPKTGASTPPLTGMDYLIKDDSLFTFSVVEWTYTGEKVEGSSGTNLFEFSISHALFGNLNGNPGIPVYASVNNEEVVLAETDGSPALLVRMPASDLPSEFTVSNSEDFNESRLVLEWEPCHFCLGYKIERSEDGTSFEQIEDLDGTKTMLNDNGLTNQKTYYYRLSTYNEFGSSGYSEVVEGTVGRYPFPLSTDAEESIIIYPNPSNGMITPGFEFQKVEIYNLQGKLVLSQTRTGMIDIKGLAKGVYMLRAYTPEGIKNIKVIRQ